MDDELRELYDLKYSKRIKYAAGPKDVRILLRQLWCKDTFEIGSELQRIQLALFILLLMDTGARPQAILADALYPHLYLRFSVSRCRKQGWCVI